MSRNKKAFTLIELLVAMAIIGVLIGLAIFGLSAAQRASRDTERRSALQDMNIGVQAYYEKYGVYPTSYQFPTSGAAAVFCNVPSCVGAPQNVTVPLKGAAIANPLNVGVTVTSVLGTTNQSTSGTNSTQANTNPSSTSYCFNPQPASISGSNLPGFVLCAFLESNVIYCVGTGAGKGNTVSCHGGTETIIN